MPDPSRVGWSIALVVAATAIGVVLGFDLATRSPRGEPGAGRGEPPDASARGVLVVTAPVTTADVSRHILGYGTVGTTSSGLRTRSLPFDCLVVREAVNAGQEVAVGELLLEVRASPAERLGLAAAEAELQAAKDLLGFVESKLEFKLATRQDLVLAKLRLDQAERSVTNKKRLGIDGPVEVRAERGGIVTEIGVRQGQLAPAGTVLVSLTDEEHLIADLGIEPEDCGYLAEGQQVEISRVRVAGAARLHGKVDTITRSVDPRTRLVRVLIELEAEADLMLNEYIETRIEVGSHAALTVPQSSVLR
ncbi:MAG: efflux RND transporter periplasmic adaptor subunit, partial [Planctomycetota bacterium]